MLEKHGPVEGSLWVYGGWFYFAGELVKAGARLTGAGSGFQYFFTDAKRLPSPLVDFGNRVLAVEFITKLP